MCDVAAVQANGQCFLARRADLLATGACDAACASLCEDVTMARTLVSAGLRVGFYEAGDLVAVRMYESGRAAWRNWPRSLPMRDQFFGVRGWLGLAEIVAVQALPLPAVVAAGAFGLAPPFVAVNGALVAMRFGVLAGMARAYVRRPWTYWLSPLADLPITARVVQSALRRRPELWAGTGSGDRTAVFLLVSTLCSLGAELLGTGTGWPFGAYTYGDALGPKVLERVPVAIPLSWFTLGLTAYVLARLAFDRLGVVAGVARSVAVAVWFFVVWDLVLDPAMAYEHMPLRFWTWHQHGPFFGMPFQNLAGWAATAALFLTLSRCLWRSDVNATRIPAQFPIAVYGANLGFAMALAASVGLWIPIVLALVLGLAPALAVWRPAPTDAIVLAPTPQRR